MYLVEFFNILGFDVIIYFLIHSHMMIYFETGINDFPKVIFFCNISKTH